MKMDNKNVTLSTEEQKKILNEFNDTDKSYRRDKTINMLFEEQVEKTPDNIALIFKDSKLTYREVNEKANQLARILREEKNIKGDSIVGIMINRSLEMIIGILAILKAGGAYLPIAANYPLKRISHIVSESKLTVILTEEIFMDKLSPLTSKIDILNIKDNKVYYGDSKNLKRVNTPKNLAYVIYTSGSTGNPKGVMIEHHSVVNRIDWMQSKYPIDNNDVILQKTPYTFDVSVWELFWWFFVGAKVCILEPYGEKEPDVIANEIKKAGVTTLHFVPSMLNVFLNYIEESCDENYLKKLISIKQVFSSGEALHINQVERFNSTLKKMNDAKLINLYGPTEATVDVTYFDCSEERSDGIIPIGKPIDNIKLYILDKNMNILPIGEQGELYIAGVGVSRGYLNNEKLTKERFIKNPFEDEGTLYKTGDLAKWDYDGNVIYIGRLDHQVKVRGFRIELGEVEKQILKYDGINEAVVIDLDDQNGNKYLAAYFAGNIKVEIEELKAFLNQTLLEYMIPSYFIQLEKMPLTPNGKVDRKSLPRPQNVLEEYVEAKTDTEKILQKIWSEVLEIEKVGIRDKFIQIGGESLKAIRILSKIRNKLNVKLKVSDIFKYSTIEKLSEYTEKLVSESNNNLKDNNLKVKKIGLKEYYETSYVQKRMYAINQSDVDSISYNEPEIYISDTRIDDKKMEKSIQNLINRHESLRTSFFVIDEKIVQKINKDVDFKVNIINIDGAFEELKEEIRGRIKKLIMPFDLTKAPLLRGSIIHLSDKDIFLLDIHHIVTDGVSSEIIMNEILNFYEEKPLPDMKYQYKDFVYWQNELFNSENMKNQEKYWINEFTGDIPVLELNTDFDRGIEPSSEGNTVYFEFDNVLKERINKILTSNNITKYMFLASAFIVLLSRYTGQDDIVIGSPSAGRNNEEFDNVVGMFVNSLPIRNKIDYNETFIEFLQHSKEKFLAAFENQDYDYGHLIDKLKVQAKQNRNPLFDVMFSVQDFKNDYDKFEDIQLKRYIDFFNISKLDITVIIDENYNGLIQYKTKLFKKNTIKRLIKNYEKILSEITENINQKIKCIDIVSDEEKRIILKNGSCDESEYNCNKSVKDIFEDIVNEKKNDIAICSNEGSITYLELNEKANQLARVLQKKNITRNDVVGIICNRNIKTIISMIAVIKLGAAYCPIDCKYPKDRKKYMIIDSGCRLVLADSEEIEGLQLEEVDFININNNLLNTESTENLSINSNPSDLMYVIYTSGSTGKPKGVCLKYEGLISRVYSHNANSMNILQVISLSFDPSVLDIWSTLLNGNKMYLANDEEIMNLNALEDIVREERVESVQLPSALFTNVVYENSKVLKGVKRVIVGGDVISPKAVSDILKLYPELEVINAYGPTENTINSTQYVIKQSWDSRKIIPIGKPIKEVNVFIVDRFNNICPIGVTGELLVGGIGLAAGYLNRDNLTKERFIESPFVKGERLYRTGDYAKWLPDGNIIYLGRIDKQVKIRGYRVELSEIEKAIVNSSEVKEVAVIDKKDRGGNKYLCAYIACDKDINVENIKESLEESIPDYMVPQHIIKVEKIPKTINGKINSKLLPEPDFDSIEDDYVKPRNEKEQIIADIWSEVLGVEKVGINSNFFTIGGDSIKAIQVVSRLSKKGIKLEVKDILKFKNIRVISNYIDEFKNNISQKTVEGEVKQSPILKEFLNVDKDVLNQFNQSMIIYNKKGFNELVVKEVLKKIIINHDALRMTMKFEKTVTLFNNGLNTELYDFKKYQINDEKNIEKFIENESQKLQKSIDLGKGPIVKAALFNTLKGDFLVFVIHHIAIDGVSWRIFLEDFSEYYQKISKGEKCDVQLKTTSFKNWIDKLYNYSESEKLKDEIKYWNSLKSEEKSLKEIRKDNAQDIILFKDIKANTFYLTEKTTKNLINKVNKAYNTEINDILLSALGLTVKQWSGIEKFAITLEGHGREDIIKDADITRTIGWFTSTYPFILDVSDNNIGMIIKTTKENLRKVPHKGIGYGIIRYLKGMDTIGVKTDISFNYLGQFDQDADGDVFEYSNIPLGNEISPEMPAKDSIQINSMVKNNKLEVKVEYSIKEYKEDTINLFVQIFKENLKRIVKYCVEKDEVELTPSDYGINDYSINDLEELKKFVSDNINEDVQIESINKLTPIQEGMLYTYKKDKNTKAYVLQMELNVDGDLKVDTFNKAYNILLDKYGVLRTIIYENWNHPSQVVLKNRQAVSNFKDLSGAEDIEGEYRKYAKGLIEKGFNLNKDILFKISVVKLGDLKYRVILTAHHIIIDGWSNSIVISELFNIYENVLNNETIEKNYVPEYKEYLSWRFNQDEYEALDYWKKYLKGYNEDTLFLSDQKAGNEYKEGVIDYSFSKELSEDLRKIASINEITLNTICQVAWALLLKTYTQSKDILFGTVVSGRAIKVRNIEKMIGIFINTIVTRIVIDDNITLRELLKKTQDKNTNGKEFEYISLSQIEKLISRKDDLIQSLMSFENFPAERNTISGDLVINELTAREETNYALTMQFEDNETLNLRIMYDQNKYSEAFIGNIINYLNFMFEIIKDNLEHKIKEIELVDEEEKNKLLYEFNNTRRPYQDKKTVKEIFEEEVNKNPNETAVVSKGQSLTYRELNEKGNYIAELLRRKNVGKGDIVSIISDRSMETIVFMIGVIKSGAAYLPIDEEYPISRIKYLLEDSNSSVLLAKENQVKKLLLDECNIDLMSISGEIGNVEKNIEIDNSSEDVVYVIYTSGSTGNPKGVLIENKGLIKTVKDVEYLSRDEAKRVLQSGSLSFDASVVQIWIAILNGGAIYLEDKELLIDASALEEYMEKNEITFMLMPTALFNEYSFEKIEVFKNMKCLMVGGDVISSIALEKLRNKYKDLRVINAYGPTENSVISTMYEVEEKWDKSKKVPIGKPISNSTAYVMNENTKLLPIGVVGELVVGGDGIAKGYLNREKLTSEKFIENPYIEGEKIYKTGDLVKLLPDGNIEFIGRKDNQVKINGFRIELGEIENSIAKRAEVKEVVVVDKKDKEGKKYLCGYIVSNEIISTEKMKEYLRKEIPQYMIPKFIMQIEKMPLTPNGKIDRNSLPEPKLDEMENKYIAPRSDEEKVIAKVWEEVLGIEKVGVDDNFYELGGHSLKAINMLLKLNKYYDLKIKIKEIYERPTVKELASYIKGEIEGLKDSLHEKSAIGKSSEKEFYEVSSAQKRMYAINQLNTMSTNYNVSGAYVISGVLDIKKIEEAFTEIINRHEILRTKFGILDGKFIQKIQRKSNFKVEILVDTKIDENNEEEVSRLIQSQIKPFNLNEANLIRVKIIKLKTKNILFIDMHHIITDGISVKILLNELIKLYEGEKLDDVKLQYRDFSEWQNKLLRSGELEKEKDFWINYLGKDIQRVNLPKDRPKDEDCLDSGSTLEIKVENDVLDGITQYTNKKKISKYTFMISVFNILLNKYTLQNNLIIGTPVSGRTNLQLNDVIGMFVNTLLIKSKINDENSFEEYLNDTNINILNVLENQDYQVELIIERLRREGIIENGDLFNILFSYEYNEISEISIDNNKLSEIELKSNSSKNEITLIASESKDGLYIKCNYDSAIFFEESIKIFLENYVDIIKLVLKNDDICIKDIELANDIMKLNHKEIEIDEFSFDF